MNWYVKHYASVNLIERLSAGICTQIFDIIKQQVVEKGLKNKYKDMSDMSFRLYPNTKILNQLIPESERERVSDVFIGMFLHIKFQDIIKDNFMINGGMGQESRTEKFVLVLNTFFARNFSYQDFRNFYLKLQMVVRHELEHFVQVILKEDVEESTGVERATNNEEIWEGWKKYYLNRSELEAFATGFYYQAKKSKNGFRDILSQYLYNEARNIIINNHLPPEEVYSFMSTIYNKYLEYAQKRYPNLNRVNTPLSV